MVQSGSYHNEKKKNYKTDFFLAAQFGPVQ